MKAPWTIVYENSEGETVCREGNSTMEYFRILNQLKFRNIEPLTTPPSL